MKNFRKIGLSALAGSLAMFSVNADIGISGSSELTYTSGSGSSGSTQLMVTHSLCRMTLTLQELVS